MNIRTYVKVDSHGRTYYCPECQRMMFSPGKQGTGAVKGVVTNVPATEYLLDGPQEMLCTACGTRSLWDLHQGPIPVFKGIVNEKDKS